MKMNDALQWMAFVEDQSRALATSSDSHHDVSNTEEVRLLDVLVSSAPAMLGDVSEVPQRSSHSATHPLTRPLQGRNGPVEDGVPVAKKGLKVSLKRSRDDRPVVDLRTLLFEDVASDDTASLNEDHATLAVREQLKPFAAAQERSRVMAAEARRYRLTTFLSLL